MENIELEEANTEKPKDRLNRAVAVTVALLATFLSVCKVKDDNIMQAMQQAQADRIDQFSWYQARNMREDLAKATAEQLELLAQTLPLTRRAAYDERITVYRKLAQEQDEKKQQQKAAAEEAQKTYDRLNFRDDQFDLSEAALSIAIAMLAIVALTHRAWLYGLAMIPAFLGILMGLAGLFGWGLHPSLLAKLLGA